MVLTPTRWRSATPRFRSRSAPRRSKASTRSSWADLTDPWGRADPLPRPVPSAGFHSKRVTRHPMLDPRSPLVHLRVPRGLPALLTVPHGSHTERLAPGTAHPGAPALMFSRTGRTLRLASAGLALVMAVAGCGDSGE